MQPNVHAVERCAIALCAVEQRTTRDLARGVIVEAHEMATDCDSMGARGTCLPRIKGFTCGWTMTPNLRLNTTGTQGASCVRCSGQSSSMSTLK